MWQLLVVFVTGRGEEVEEVEEEEEEEEEEGGGVAIPYVCLCVRNT